MEAVVSLAAAAPAGAATSVDRAEAVPVAAADPDQLVADSKLAKNGPDLSPNGVDRGHFFLMKWL